MSLCEPIATFRTGGATGTGGSSVTVGETVDAVAALSTATSVAGASEDPAGATGSGEEDATSEGEGVFCSLAGWLDSELMAEISKVKSHRFTLFGETRKENLVTQD